MSFRAHRNYINQSGWTPNLYKPIEWTAYDYADSNVMAGVWTAPEGIRTTLWSGQLWIAYGADGAPWNYVAKLFKNGHGIMAWICTPGTFPNSAVIAISGADQCVPGDRYQLQLYASNADASLDGHPAHTFFSLTALP